MPIEPKISNKNLDRLIMKKCAKCEGVFSSADFAHTRAFFYKDNLLPICNSCATTFLEQRDFTWDSIDRLCQWADIPFIVKEWTRLEELNGKKEVWAIYSNVFRDTAYEGIGWATYDKQYRALREGGYIEQEIPLVREEKYRLLRKKWGANYDDEALDYLEELFRGLLTTQNVNGALQTDQAKKICKLSFEIDSKIRAGDKDVDKFLSSYDRLVKIAEFTPKNTKSAADFDSFAELALWLEKRGRQNKFYDNTTRDIIDETLKNIENYNQRLYINEGGIGEEITERIEALKISQESDDLYETKTEYDLDEYDNAGYNFEAEDETFELEIEGEE